MTYWSCMLTLGMDRRREDIVNALVEVVQPKGIYERSDVSIRELEGLERARVFYTGNVLATSR